MATDNVFLFVWNPCDTRVLGLKNSRGEFFCELVHLSDRFELMLVTYVVLPFYIMRSFARIYKVFLSDLIGG